MSRILVTGAASGLGAGAARELLAAGHDVVVHARTEERAESIRDVLERGGRLVTADLSDLEATRDLATQVERLGGVDAIIHNAGVLDGRRILPVNVVAPYLLTALVPARRLVFLSSGMHNGGRATVAGLDWSGGKTSASYSDSKLLVTTLAFAAWRRLDVQSSHAVDPGWVPTAMGGPGAPDDLEAGHQTQAWLAAGEEPETDGSAYWYHRTQRTPHPSTRDERFQDELLEALAAHTGVALPA
ncbi:short-subunit dehydrogenase [Labedella gwakjiensis]|uniref:SDR family NAD(P)-dependent oxidoreductase n=1 Tax=Labedella gwakjiensis TaxID=390269 RepID=A0A2P8GTQ4_9MICO|nr:SDR family NAD(P)-dependent oxidoreductase [Labedella gwakjiensis]PSL37348.1 short-subunit dehydrogenase [Labedella gwakjiensis]RUQ84669.1 SDR family NAD(P)-dependent oxidoreductase [Labedella gwakjiensis]